jgi:hypothetical protein
MDRRWLVLKRKFFSVCISLTPYTTKDATMLITFTSKSSADVLMYEIHAKPLLDLLDKDIQRGVITAEETTEAIARIESAITDSKRQPDTSNQGKASDKADDDFGDPVGDSGVSFGARAFPLLEMLRAAQRDKQFVMWGV